MSNATFVHISTEKIPYIWTVFYLKKINSMALDKYYNWSKKIYILDKNLEKI